MESATLFKHISTEQVHQGLTDSQYTVVDIRDPQSFKTSRIPGAIHLSNESIGDFMREADLDAPLVVCCYHGHSSQQAAQYLIAQDFTDVYSLDGGFTEWQTKYPEAVDK